MQSVRILSMFKLLFQVKPHAGAGRGTDAGMERGIQGQDAVRLTNVEGLAMPMSQTRRTMTRTLPAVAWV